MQYYYSNRNLCYEKEMSFGIIVRYDIILIIEHLLSIRFIYAIIIDTASR